MNKRNIVTLAVACSFAMCAAGQSRADPIRETFDGTLPTDDAVAFFTIQLTQPSDLQISTDSYGGGANLDGTTTPAGGFVPVISLFDPNGHFIASDGADIGAPGAIDPSTGIADDAALSEQNLAPGGYTLAVSEFFNFPNGDLSDGFFAAGQGNFTGPTCSQPSGSFLETDLVACPQRTDAFSVNVSATNVPEPATLSLFAVALCGVAGLKRRERVVLSSQR